MVINAKLFSIGLSFGLIGAVVWATQECTGKQYWEGRTGKLEKDSIRWGKDSVKFVGAILTQRYQIEKAIRSANDWKAKFNGQVIVSDQQVDELTHRQKQIALLRGLVANKTLAPIYLRDTLRISTLDTALLTATLKTTKREAIASSSVDSLLGIVGMQGAEIDRLNTRHQKAWASSLFAQEKLLNLSERKPLFSKSRRKQAREDAAEVRTIRESEISDLERVINQ